MGSDGDGGQGGIGSDPSSHGDYGGNYGGEPGGGVSGSENSFGRSNSASSANLGFSGEVGGWGSRGPDGSIGGFGSGGVSDLSALDWSGFLDHVNNALGFASAAQAVGVPAPLGVVAYGFTQLADFALSNPHMGSYATPADQGVGAPGAELAKPSVQAKPVTAFNGHPDWNSFLTDINSRFRTRAANQPTNFTSLLED